VVDFGLEFGLCDGFVMESTELLLVVVVGDDFVEGLAGGPVDSWESIRDDTSDLFPRLRSVLIEELGAVGIETSAPELDDWIARLWIETAVAIFVFVIKLLGIGGISSGIRHGDLLVNVVMGGVR
jgi:hypothetical protein